MHYLCSFFPFLSAKYLCLCCSWCVHVALCSTFFVIIVIFITRKMDIFMRKKEKANPERMSEGQETTNTTTNTRTSEEQKQPEEVKEGWGYLEAFDGVHPTIELVSEEKTVVGRGDARYGLTSTAVSNTHFRIWRERATVGGDGHWVFFVEDLSTNGTFVDGERLPRGSARAVEAGCDVSVLDPRRAGGGGVTYRFVDRASEAAEAAQGGPQRAYALGPVLGRGSFARVRRATCRADGRAYALKIVAKERALRPQSARDPVRDEAGILLRVRHPHVIGVREIFETPRCFYIVLELVAGGDLRERLCRRGRLPEATARDVAHQLLDAVAYLHAHGIAHRDIKPENVLLAAPDTFDTKLTDFGLSRVVGEGRFMRTMCGTPLYVAPEVLRSLGTGGYTDAVDLWSLGVILYLMLSGAVPFPCATDTALFAAIKAGAYAFPSPQWDGISPAAIDLVRRMMTVDPARRITAVDALSHEWFTSASSSSSAAAPESSSSSSGSNNSAPTSASAPAAGITVPSQSSLMLDQNPDVVGTPAAPAPSAAEQLGPETGIKGMLRSMDSGEMCPIESKKQRMTE